MSQPAFKIIIVGCSVTGLTLAHCLDKLGVEYTILEKRSAVVLQEGASVAVMPNGGRILDQLGLYDAFEKATVPLDLTDAYLPDQDFRFTSDYPRRVLATFGYPLAFMERRGLLEILYDGIADKSNIHVNKAVTHVEQNDAGAKVHTEDGEVYEGDIVVGADGIHSKTLREMWRMMGEPIVNGISQSESQNMSVAFSCVFGISHDVPELQPGEQILRMCNGSTVFVMGSKGVVFWFIVTQLDRRYEYHDAPRYTTEEAAAFCEARKDAEIKEGVTFECIWRKQHVFNMLPLQESLFQTWSHGRVVCIGDSVHKMTINLGQGANCAIEDVTVFCNMLHRMLAEKREKKPSYSEIDTLLRRFNKEHLPRASAIVETSRLTTRVHAQVGPSQRIMSRWVVPYFGKLLQGKPLGLIANGPVLDFLPLKRTSFPGWERYRARRGSRGAGFWITAFLSLSLLAFAATTYGWGNSQIWADWNIL
ncbi:FAD binding monooxygenase [Apiospora arundinis]